MVSSVPSLTGAKYITDPESIIAYTLRKYMRTPKHTIPILPDLIISLPWTVAQFHTSPNTLCDNMQSELQNCFNRIFNGERTITVTVNYDTPEDNGNYTVSITVMYATISGDLNPISTSISVGSNGRLVIPEDRILASLL